MNTTMAATHIKLITRFSFLKFGGPHLPHFLLPRGTHGERRKGFQLPCGQRLPLQAQEPEPQAQENHEEGGEEKRQENRESHRFLHRLWVLGGRFVAVRLEVAADEHRPCQDSASCFSLPFTASTTRVAVII